MGSKELQYINDAFKSNWIAPLGPNLNAFEKSLSRYCNVKYVAALSSGTAAIHLALIILGIKQGDEVLASSFTFSATVNPIVYLGAKPILVDSEKETWNMDPGLLEEAIKDRIKKGKKPKALILVHLYGMPAHIEELLGIAESYEIPVIEDAAEALGSHYLNKSVGSFGKIGILSFNGNKIITTSGGGALISNDKYIVEKARFLSTQARDKAPHYQHSQIGYNYRMSNVLAGIGLGQMEVLKDRVRKRRENFSFYKKELSVYDMIHFQEEPNNKFFSNHWLTTIILDNKKTDLTPERLRLALQNENIESRPLWKPMHLQPVFSTFPNYLNGTSEEFFSSGLCLPSGSNLTEEERIKVVSSVVKCLTR